MENNQEMVTIPKGEYDELKKRDLLLSCLESAGVDNWEGWDYAKEMFNNDNE